MITRIADIVSAIEQYASPSLQESWDNTGLQVGNANAECTGVLVCLESTPAVVAEAAKLGCNLIISHHPLFFRPIKRLTGTDLVSDTAIAAIVAGVAIYSSHTASDSTRRGVSVLLAEKLGITPAGVLAPVHQPEDSQELGLGIYGDMEQALSPAQFVEHVKACLGCPAVRTTHYDAHAQISRAAVCGGAGGEFIQAAIDKGAQAYVTADIKYHDFVNYRDRILLVDAGHYETEALIKQKFREIVSEKFPHIPVHATALDDNPVCYL